VLSPSEGCAHATQIGNLTYKSDVGAMCMAAGQVIVLKGL